MTQILYAGRIFRGLSDGAVFRGRYPLGVCCSDFKGVALGFCAALHLSASKYKGWERCSGPLWDYMDSYVRGLLAVLEVPAAIHSCELGRSALSAQTGSVYWDCTQV